MHPFITQAVAAQRSEDMRRDAAVAQRVRETRRSRRAQPSRRRGPSARVPAAA